MKTLLEGKGGFIRNLYQAFTLQFAGAKFLFGSNSLPDISQQHLFPKQYQDDWLPITSRCKFVYMPESYSGDKCPYTLPILAHCIKKLVPSEKVEPYQPQHQPQQ
jgi:hypothetical protein